MRDVKDEIGAQRVLLFEQQNPSTGVNLSGITWTQIKNSGCSRFYFTCLVKAGSYNPPGYSPLISPYVDIEGVDNTVPLNANYLYSLSTFALADATLPGIQFTSISSTTYAALQINTISGDPNYNKIKLRFFTDRSTNVIENIKVWGLK